MRTVLVDFHIEMWKLGGMSNPVMHNEVAPGQLEISPKLSVRTFCPNAPANMFTLLLHKNLLRTLTDLENVVIEGRTQTLDETFACLGRRAKSSKSLSSSSRSWRTSLTFVVTPCAHVSYTLEVITCWEHRNYLRPSSLYARWL